jgi:hypothetical protein
MTNTTDTAIHSRAMLVRLSVTSWAARKLDKKITKEVNEQHAASKEAGRYNKHLLGGKNAAPSHASAVSSAGAARLAHYADTLPWADEGWRLLPTANYEQYTAAIRKARATFEEDVEQFLADYPALVAKARGLLNGMFKEDDYPSVETLRGKFSMEVEFSPVPSEGDFRLDLPDDQVAAVASSVTSRVESATKEAMNSAWERLRDSVKMVAERLGDPKAKVFDSLIENVREIADVLSRLNVTNDPDLEAMRQRVADDLSGIAPDVMRKNAGARSVAAAKAAAILKAMDGVYGN